VAKKSTFCIDLDPELRLDLECFREANFHTPACHVVRPAIREFIDRRLDADAKLKVEFDSIKSQKRRQASAMAGNKVSFLPKRNRRRTTAS